MLCRIKAIVVQVSNVFYILSGRRKQPLDPWINGTMERIMDQSYLQNILNHVAEGKMDPDEAMEQLKALPFQDLGFAKLDQHRNIRTGYPETVYCEGKTPEQAAAIISKLKENNSNILGTRASAEVFEKVKEIVPEAVYHPAARIITVRKNEALLTEKIITVVTAGTSDIPVAEEAALTAETMGNQVDRTL